MIRKATQQDLSHLIPLMHQLGYTPSLETLLQNLSHNSVWVYEEEKILGCLAYHILQPFHTHEKHMRIISLVTDQSLRRQGIGKKLMAFAETKARELGCSLIELTSASHRMQHGVGEFYTSLGFIANQEKIYFRKTI